MLIVIGCSDSRPKPPPATTTVSDAAVARIPSPDAELALTMSWIGVRLDGLTIIEVIENTPAKQAGVVAGDQLVSLYGEPIQSVRPFIDQIARTPPGATIPLTVSRGGAEVKLSITVAPRPAEQY
jgi:S1-C subfamily serine protease